MFGEGGTLMPSDIPGRATSVLLVGLSHTLPLTSPLAGMSLPCVEVGVLVGCLVSKMSCDKFYIHVAYS